VTTHDPIKLAAVGDICPGDHFCPGFGVRSLARRYGQAFAFQHSSQLLRDADIVFGNCEGVLSDVGAQPDEIDTMEFRGEPSFARALRDCGFSVITVANNHVGEHGLEALLDTTRNLNSAGIEVIGLRGKNGAALPLIQTIRGVKIGWLAYTWIVSKHTAQDRQILAWTRGDDVPAEVAALRSEVDFLIVSAHWGREFIAVPPQKIIDQARSIVDAGADLVLGHHPHVLQGTEWRGQSLIVYSLGNFLFDMWQARLRKTAIFRCTIGDGRILTSEFVPLIINKSFQPMPAPDHWAAQLKHTMEQRSKALQDPKYASVRDNARAAKLEAAWKRWLFRTQLLHLLFSVGRMGPQISFQKICRRVPGLARLCHSSRSYEAVH
jgi:poly-gamma-glutamate synthesis protein (capsule biosynthesis protein)